jgi:hypothetical protein
VFGPIGTEWSGYVGAGAGYLDLYLRAGLDFAPRSRARLGPDVSLGGRALAGFGVKPPRQDRLPAAAETPEAAPVSYYSGILGELAVGLRVPQIGGSSPRPVQLLLAPTFLAGPFWYESNASPGGHFVEVTGVEVFYGGTIEATVAW